MLGFNAQNCRGKKPLPAPHLPVVNVVRDTCTKGAAVPVQFPQHTVVAVNLKNFELRLAK